MLVRGDRDRAFFPVLNGHRHDLCIERTVRLGRQGFLMRIVGELVLRFARHRILAAQILGGFDHSTGHRMIDAARANTPALQSILHLEIALLAPPDIIGEEAGVGHGFRSADHDQLGPAGGDRHHAVDHRLQAGPAASIDLQTRGSDG